MLQQFQVLLRGIVPCACIGPGARTINSFGPEVWSKAMPIMTPEFLVK